MQDGINAGVSKRATLFIASLASFVGSFISTAVNIALPSIGDDLAMGAVALGWVANVTLLATAAILLPVGRLADIYGRKKVFLYGMLVFTITSFLCAVAGSTAALIVYRALQGLSLGVVYGTSVALVISVYPGRERGRAIGITVAVVYLGLTLAPYIGGLMTQYWGWRSIFYLTAALALVVVILSLWKLRGEWVGAGGERYDAVGSATFFVSLILAMYGFTLVPAVNGFVLLALGLLGLAAFIWWEQRVDSPLLDIKAVRRNTVFIFSNLATLINYCSVYAVTFLMSLYLQYIQGLQPQDAGLFLLVRSAVMMIVAPVSGRLSDRFDPRRLAAVGMGLNCLALVLFVFLSENTPAWFYVTALVVTGAGIGIFSSPNMNAVMGSIDKAFVGVASGTLGTMRTGGMMLSIAIVVVLFSVFIGEAQITPEYYPAFLTSVRVGFIIFAALCLVGVFAQLAGRTPGAATGQ